MHTAADGSASTTTYWADGTRRAFTEILVSGVADADSRARTTTFHWNGNTLVDERHEANGESVSVVSYLLGASRHARTAGGVGQAASTRYLDADRHGNVTELTDERGEPVTRYEYTDYGVTTETALAEASPSPEASAPPEAPGPPAERNPFRYAGEYTDRDGSQPLGQRTYDAGTMRFTTEDPASTELTRYAYADLNPIMRTDPSGEAATADVAHWAVTALIVTVTVASTIMDAATAGTALAVFGIVMLGVADLAITALDAANQQTQFMPDSIAMTLGFVIAASGLLTAGMFTKLGAGRMRPASEAGEQAAGAGQAAVEMRDITVAGRERPEWMTRRLAVLWHGSRFVAEAPNANWVQLASFEGRLRKLHAKRAQNALDVDAFVNSVRTLPELAHGESIEVRQALVSGWMRRHARGVDVAQSLRTSAIEIRDFLEYYDEVWSYLEWYGLHADAIGLIKQHTFSLVLESPLTGYTTVMHLDDYAPFAAALLEAKVIAEIRLFEPTSPTVGGVRLLDSSALVPIVTELKELAARY
jgi:RHS repeat-associated protein